MRRSPETSIKAALGDTLPAVLGLVALTFSQLASAGVTSLCDSRTIDPPDLDIDATELTVQLIDHGLPAPVDLDVAVDIDTRALPSPPDADAMLQQVFDLAKDFDADGALTSSPARSFPVAELAPSTIETEASVSGAEATDAAMDEDVAPPAVSTRIPGLSEEDLRRYRHKMYRTDI